MLGAMEGQAARGDFSKHLRVEPFTEAGEIASRYNLVLDKFNREVNERERTANQLRDARDVAELANASKSQFLANMSHELRTPLNAIIGFSEVMNGELFGPIENDRYKDYVVDIHKSSSHLLSLINDILDLSKIEADRYELYEEELDVVEVMASCERMMRHRAEEAGVDLGVTVEQDLPLLNADKRALRQIMLNLVSNAVKFTPKGGHIELAAFTEPDERMAFRVSDHRHRHGQGRHPDRARALPPDRQGQQCLFDRGHRPRPAADAGAGAHARGDARHRQRARPGHHDHGAYALCPCDAARDGAPCGLIPLHRQALPL